MRQRASRQCYTLKRESQESTMAVTLDLSPEREAALTTWAKARGMSLEQWLIDLAEQAAPPTSIAHLQKTDPREWARQFHAWAENHDRTTPLLSDEAISRDNSTSSATGQRSRNLSAEPHRALGCRDPADRE
jgi:hypothetical protein